jgi:hypothetical protein
LAAIAASCFAVTPRVLTPRAAACCRNGFQKMDKIKDSNRQSKQLEDLTGKMRECKR